MLPERYTAGARLEVDEDDVPVVIPPVTAAHLRALADVLLRNGESGAFKAYVEVHPLAAHAQGSGQFLRPCAAHPYKQGLAVLYQFCVRASG